MKSKVDTKQVKDMVRRVATVARREAGKIYATYQERLKTALAESRPAVLKPEYKVEAPKAVELENQMKQAADSGKRRGRSQKIHVRGRKSDAMTREELYEEAKRLDIPGRSKMSKRQLIQAIQRQ